MARQPSGASAYGTNQWTQNRAAEARQGTLRRGRRRKARRPKRSKGGAVGVGGGWYRNTSGNARHGQLFRKEGGYHDYSRAGVSRGPRIRAGVGGQRTKKLRMGLNPPDEASYGLSQRMKSRRRRGRKGKMNARQQAIAQRLKSLL